MSAPFPGMSIRTRLVLGVLGLLAAGFFIALGATWAALEDARQDINHEILTRTGQRLSATLSGRPAGSRTLRVVDEGPGVDPDDLEASWRDLARDGDIPSFVQIRNADGSVRQSLGMGAQPQLPVPLDPRHRPPEPAPDRPHPERFVPASDATGRGWLVRVSPLGSDGETLLVGMSSSTADELLSRTASVAVVSTALTVAAVALLALAVVGRGLRPLEDMARTAVQIGEGDLALRVVAGPPGTEVGRLGTAFNTMVTQLEQAFAERAASQERLRRFVADAAHELRTPVATIRGHAALFRLGGAERPEDHAKILRRVESETTRMGALVDEMLLLARLDQGRALDMKPVALHHLASDAVTDARARDPRRRIDLEVEPATVIGDEPRLRQVLDNLLSNVLQHTDRTCPAMLVVRAEAGSVVVEVADSGPGLQPEERERVLDRFYRAEGATARAPGGSGLGLSIVAAVVEAHGGSVEVESEFGVGTTIIVRLPAGP